MVFLPRIRRTPPGTGYGSEDAMAMVMVNYEAQTSVGRYNVSRLIKKLSGTGSDMICCEDQREEATLYIQT